MIVVVTNSLRLNVDGSNAKKTKKNIAVLFDVFERFVEYSMVRNMQSVSVLFLIRT